MPEIKDSTGSPPAGDDWNNAVSSGLFWGGAIAAAFANLLAIGLAYVVLIERPRFRTAPKVLAISI